MSRETLRARQVQIRKIIATLKRTHPDAKLALNFSNPLELLMSLILAAQCRDTLVNEVTAKLFQKYRTAKDWTKLRQEEVAQISFFRNKTRAIHGSAGMLLEKFQGEVPAKMDELLTLPGVGRKTANAVLANAFDQPAIVVDTHVWRLSQRLGLTKKDQQDVIEADLVNIVPRKEWTKFCHLLQFHGRRVCAARKPDCLNCSLNQLCPKIGVK